MNINQLEYFCVAAKCQSITQAARKMYVTQPAISGAIRELEKEFSIKLFSNVKNRMVLTEEGQRFYERAQLLLRDVDIAVMQLHDLGAARSVLRIGIPPLWGSTFFPDLSHEFGRKHPQIQLVFYEYGSARAAHLVQEGELDVGLVNLCQDDPEKFHSVCIGRDRVVVAVDPSHRFAREKRVTMEELAGVPLVMYNTDSVLNGFLKTGFEQMGIKPNVQIYTSQIYTMKSMVHNNTCVAFFYESLLQDHPDLVGVPVEPAITQQVGLIWRKDRYIPESIQAFVNFVKDYPLFPEMT